MANAVCIGAQWGDEGKGRIVDRLSERADLVVRYHGGNNAGHTVVVDGATTILHIVPSGVLHPDKLCVIGAGCVIDPEVLLQEMEMLQARKLLTDTKRLVIADEAHVILPFHKRIDKAREAQRGAEKLGTTGRGIGPAYEDKAARRGMRMHDLIDAAKVPEQVRQGAMYANSMLEAVGAEPYRGDEIEEMITRTRAHGQKLKPFVDDAGEVVANAAAAGKRVLFEGAQGALLDLDHGTYPYVTSSNCLAGHASVGAGVGPNLLGRVIGVAKAYTTRVGSGPFPTELADPLGAQLRDKGGEYGATTGRPRRCGWLDLVALRYATRLNGMTDLALTKLDVLSGFGDLHVCVAYEVDGQRTERFPHDAAVLARAKPIYETFPGFGEVPDRPRSFDELPAPVRNYARAIAERIGVRLSIVAAGPGRGQELVLEDPLA
ncbi:MAG: adenylosuccinate synthase [Deltaproteobacteria bacterium]|jgi:adenylosuccinate synthase|nr:adenylosuccinate synthase [Deltaproteobacteria bacterium]